MLTPTPKQLFDAMAAKGHRVFSGALNLNLLGLRSPERKADAWDDLIGALYQDLLGDWRAEFYVATTDPGRYWLEHPGNRAGTAILVPGQYRSCWTFGLHRQRYDALVQRQPMSFVRDRNFDDYLDVKRLIALEEATSAIIGCNLHRASAHKLASNVGRYSAACQVIRDARDFAAILDLCHESADAGYGDWFSYTLLDWPPQEF